MSLGIHRSRAIGLAFKRSARFLCDRAASAPPSAKDSAASPGRRSFLKYAILSALTGATAFTGYVSYAYSLDEVDQKMKSFREFVMHSAAGDGGTALDKFQGFVYSSAMTVPAKAVELYLDARRLVEENIQSYTEPYSDKLLPDVLPQERPVFTLVLDLEETLLNYAWTRELSWQNFKRPGVDAFLEHLAQFYEMVVYTDEQSSNYIDSLLDLLDPKHFIKYRLSRPATKYQDGKYFRDLSKLNRDPEKVLYLSGHALENCLQPENCVPIKPWTHHDKDDTALLDFIPFLESVAHDSPADIRPLLGSYQGCDIPSEFIRRSKENQKRMKEQNRRGQFWWFTV